MNSRRTSRIPSHKRPFDLTLLALAHLFPPLLVMWILLWAAIPLIIWLDDRGSIFFRQTRVGKDGKPFTVLKFRTMVGNAQDLGPGWTGDDDSRVTRVGRILRRTALDELPQILSIWKGEMSLVGPRALPVEMHADYVGEEPRFALRLNGLPGLAGMSQLYLPRHCDPTKRLGYDLLYLEKSGLLLDIRIVLMAVWLTLSGGWGRGSRRPEA